MSLHVIKVPDIGEGIAEVELVAWRVKAGEDIAEDQILADVMTDKATVEIPSPVAGRVLALGGEIGQMLAVGSELIRIDAVAEDGAASGSASATNTRAQPRPATPPTGSTAATRVSVPPARAPIETMAQESPTHSPAASPRVEPTPPSPIAESGHDSADAGARPIASPALRAKAWERGIDLRDVPPSGPGGRIMQRDLDAYEGPRSVPRPPAEPDPSWAAVPSTVATSPSSGPAPRRVETARSAIATERPASGTHVEKIVGMRRKIAQKMQESKRRIPHFAYVEELDVGELEALREQLNAQHANARGHLTLLPFLVRAIVLATREVPQVNALFDDEAGILTRHDAVHLGIATQTGNGLMVPVLRHAEALDLWTSSAEISRLAGAARSGKIVRDELSGSTLTLTSLGRLGGIVSTPVINHPEVAIVGVNRIVKRPVVRDDIIVIRPMMNLSSSFDHRVVDGAMAAEFVQKVRERLEHPALLFVE